MLAICAADTPMVFKAPKTSSKAKSVSQGTKPGAKPGHKKLSTSSKQPSVSSKEAAKGGSSKAPTSSKTGHSKKRKESSSAIDLNPRKPLVSTLVDTGMHKEDQQATGGQTSLGVTSEARVNPQLSNGMSTFNLNDPIYSASFIIHSKSASGNNALAISIAEANPGKSAPRIEASSIARKVEEDEASNIIKLEDLAKLVSDVPCFKDLDSPKDDPVIAVNDSDKDKEDEAHQFQNPHFPFEAEVALLKAQPSFPNVGQLNELLVKSLQTEFSKILSTHDFSSSLPTELKDLPSKFNELIEEVALVQAKLKPLDALPGLLLNVTTALNKRAKKNAEKENLNNQQPKPITPPATTIIPPVITTTTTQMQSPPKNPQKGSSQPEGENIKKDKGKKTMSSKDVEEVSTESKFDDETTHMPGSMVESSKKKDLKKFDFVTKDGEHVHLTEEQIGTQKKIEKEAKAKAARHEGEMRKEELIDLLGPEVVNKYSNDKL
ncbi:hypothetical protein Tco_1379071 [Tanacetum coccineum]